MCSLTESALEPELVAARPTGPRLCKKCGTGEVRVVLRGKDCYCTPCFLLGVQHKVRASLGKHKATRPGERVAVGAGGGPASLALLHLLEQGLRDTKRLLFTPVVVWVDCGAELHRDQQTRNADTQQAIQILSSFGLEVHTALLEDFAQPEVRVWGAGCSVPLDTPRVEEVRAWLGAVRDPSGRQELRRIMKAAVLAGAAKTLGCSKVLTAETATDLAVELLAGVAGGAGGNLAPRLAFRQEGEAGVAMLRPMKEVSAREAALYCHHQRLKPLSPAPTSASTIRGLTRQFVVGLQAQFPSTVPTVCKTGAKLGAGQGDGETGCSLCFATMDTDTGAGHCALQATQYSSFLSAGGGARSGAEPSNCSDKAKSGGCCGEGDGSCGAGAGAGPGLADCRATLCYSCRRALHSVTDPALLPRPIRTTAASRSRRDKMRAEISDFLL